MRIAIFFKDSTIKATEKTAIFDGFIMDGW